MTRGLTPAQTAAISGTHRQIVPLVEIYFKSGTLMLALGPWDYTALAGTYVHTGPLAYVRAASESASSQEGLEIGMSGLDTGIVALTTSEPYRGRIGRILKGILQPDSNQPVGEPVVWFVGRMKSMTITEDNSTANVVIQLEHFESELSKAAPLRYSDADQQRLHPGDLGCQFSADTANKTIIWPSREAQGA